MRSLLMIFLVMFLPIECLAQQMAPVVSDTVLPNGNIQRTTTATQVFTPAQYSSLLQNLKKDAAEKTSRASSMQAVIGK